MVLKFYLNDDEIRQFFADCGYTCKSVEKGHWEPVYHNKSEYVKKQVLVVEHGEKQINAEELMKETIKARLMSTDLGAKLAIKKALKNHK